MAIDPLDASPPTHPEQIYKPTPRLSEKISKLEAPSLIPQGDPQDSVNLTPEQEAYDSLQEKIADLPDLRRERIEKLREAIESGEYQVSTEDVADRLIKDTILNNPYNKR